MTRLTDRIAITAHYGNLANELHLSVYANKQIIGPTNLSTQFVMSRNLQEIFLVINSFGSCSFVCMAKFKYGVLLMFNINLLLFVNIFASIKFTEQTVLEGVDKFGHFEELDKLSIVKNS